jgi:hypothetical protein
MAATETIRAPALALREVGRVQPQIRPIADKGAIEEGVHAIIGVAAELADRVLADAGQPHRLHQLVDAAGGDVAELGAPLPNKSVTHR